MSHYTSELEKPIAIVLAAPYYILMAEDDADIRFINTKAMVGAGYLVDEAEDGEAAWELLKIKSYQLLITDYSMPKMSGLELIVKLRSAKIAMPVILVSGTMPTEELRWHSWLYIDAVLAKPYSLSDLLKTIKEVLDSSAAARERI